MGISTGGRQVRARDGDGKRGGCSVELVIAYEQVTLETIAYAT